MRRTNYFGRRLFRTALILSSILGIVSLAQAQTGSWQTIATSPATVAYNTITGKVDTVRSDVGALGYSYLIDISNVVGDSVYLLVEQDSIAQSVGNAGRRIVIEARGYISATGDTINGGIGSFVALVGRAPVDTLRRLDTTDVFAFGIKDLAADYLELRMRTTNVDTAAVKTTTTFKVTWRIQGRVMDRSPVLSANGHAKSYVIPLTIGGASAAIDTALETINLSQFNSDSLTVIAEQDSGTLGARKIVLQHRDYFKDLGNIGSDSLTAWSAPDTIQGVTRKVVRLDRGQGSYKQLRLRTTPNDSTGFGAATEPSRSSVTLGIIGTTSK
jgi:hypothetical protein